MRQSVVGTPEEGGAPKLQPKAYDIAVGVWQHKWSTDVSAVVAIDPSCVVRCFYESRRLDLVHFSNLGSGGPSSSSPNRRRQQPTETVEDTLAAAWEEHEAYMERPQVTVREVGCVSLVPYMDLLKLWTRSQMRRLSSSPTCTADAITGRAFSVHHFTLVNPRPAHTDAKSHPSRNDADNETTQEYLLCLAEGCPNACLVFRIHQYQRYSFTGMCLIHCPSLEVSSYSPTHMSVFGSTSTQYALAYDANSGAYAVLHLERLVAVAAANGAPHMARPDGEVPPPPPPDGFIVETGMFEKDWCDVVWKGTPHALSTRHRFYCYNAVTGATAYESVRVAEEHALLETIQDGELVHTGDSAFTQSDGGEEKPFATDHADADGGDDGGSSQHDPPERPIQNRRLPSQRRMTFSPCRRELLTRRPKGSLLIPMCLEGTVGALLYSHSHATVPGGGRSTGRVPRIEPHRAASSPRATSPHSSSAVSAMLRKRVFDHQQPWSVCALIGGLVGGGSAHSTSIQEGTVVTEATLRGGRRSSTVGGLSGTTASSPPPSQGTYLLTYSKITGAVWLSRIYKIGVAGRKSGLDVSLPSLNSSAANSPFKPAPVLARSAGDTSGGRALPPVPTKRRPTSGSRNYSPNRKASGVGSRRGSSAGGSGSADSGTPRRFRSPNFSSENGDNVVLLDEDGSSVSGRPSHITTRFSSPTGASRSTITVSTRAHSPRAQTDYQSVVVREMQTAEDDEEVQDSPSPSDLPNLDYNDADGADEDIHQEGDTNGALGASGSVNQSLGGRGGGDSQLSGGKSNMSNDKSTPATAQDVENDGDEGFVGDSEDVGDEGGGPKRAHKKGSSNNTVTPLTHTPSKPWGNAGRALSTQGALPRALRSKYASNKGAMEEWRRYAASQGRPVPPVGKDDDPHIEPHSSGPRKTSVDRAKHRREAQQTWEADGVEQQSRSLRPSRNRSSSTPRREVTKLLKRPHAPLVAPTAAAGFSARILRRHGRNIHFNETTLDDEEEEEEEPGAATANRWEGEEDLQALHSWLDTPQGSKPRGAPSLLDRLRSRAAGMPTLTGEFTEDIETLLKTMGASPQVLERALEMLQDGSIVESDEEEGASRKTRPGSSSAWCSSTRPSGAGAFTFATSPPPTSPFGKFLQEQEKKRQEREASEATFSASAAERLFKPVHTREAFIAREFAKIDKAMPRNCDNKDPKEVKKTLNKLGVVDIDIRKANTEVRRKRYEKAEAAGRHAYPKLSPEEQEALVTKMYEDRTRMHRQNMERLIRLRDKKESIEVRTLTSEELASSAERLGGSEVHKQKEAVVSSVLKEMEARLPPKLTLDRSVLEEVGNRLFHNEKPPRRPNTAA